MSKDYLRQLTHLIMDEDLEQLEKLLDPFNIFEAIGMTRQELRHSNFLAYLLNPRQNHGLGDAFLKRLLQKALLGAPENRAHINPIDVDLWSADQVLVLREHLHIDILLIDEASELAIIIENKIGTSEHDNQLNRYYADVTQFYPRCKKVVGLYLTPGGSMPSETERYISVDYGLIRGILLDLIQSRSSTLGADVHTAISHYTQMLGRHIVEDLSIAELCRRIYQKHQSALDMIFEYRPDRQLEVRRILEDLIRLEPSVVPDKASKRHINFRLLELINVTTTKSKTTGSSLGHSLHFKFENERNKLWLALYSGPIPTELQQKLKEIGSAKDYILKPEFFDTWARLYSRTLLGPKDYEDISNDELEGRIRNAWSRFLAEDLPRIKIALNEIL
jgi:hypothetical protein